MKYNLTVINDDDFEKLAKDLLERELQISLQIFKTGKDGGIDLRYAMNVENEIIVQAKHFINSKYSDLKTQLVKEHKSMTLLTPQPQRYILITSLALSTKQTDEIVKLMSPYILTSQDVYGMGRIESMLTKFEDLETKHYKLWITSTNVLRNVLNNGIKGVSEFYEQKILRKVSLYVPTINYQDGVDKLNEHKFIVISGEPGIGKTTISYLLICGLLAKGFKLVFIDDKIPDAHNIIADDPELKQVIFFDDFFGSNIYEILNPRNSESALISLIERVRSLKNKYLILTSRTTILKQAEYNYDKFARSRLGAVSNYEVQIKAYSKFDKAKILYNHLYHSDLPGDQLKVFFAERNYMKIIEHDNYFPRLIEFITTSVNLEGYKGKKLVEFIFSKLDHPDQIWESVFEKQLQDTDRFLLTTLFSFGGSRIHTKVLENAFENRFKYEISNNGHKAGTNDFKTALKRLLDGLITGRAESEGTVYSFINPSVNDFLIKYLNESPSQQKRILYSATYFEQLYSVFDEMNSSYVTIPPEIVPEFYEEFKKHYRTMRTIRESDQVSQTLNSLYIFLRFFTNEVDVTLLIELVKRIIPAKVNVFDEYRYSYALEMLNEFPETKTLIASDYKTYFNALLDHCDDSDNFSSAMHLLNSYGIDADTWQADEEFMEKLQVSVNRVFEGSVDDISLDASEQEILRHCRNDDRDKAEELVNEVYHSDYQKFLKNCGLDEFYNDFSDHLSYSIDDRIERIVDSYDYEPDRIERGVISTEPPVADTDSAIIELFER
ncbi:restriction endonuclease [Mucilaginibacter sp. 44-25]|uniref:nSTAND3 domain-containing NTPase n=1 Tax=Mucilaginibacter sp. 44-25 TaxID=1895794 RepID=UPI00095D0891|nr:restriction endonuclease [Mucilaginibacter sp. 44-25]OJW12777.1 MAG: hypothetical protein BGO48_02530 [Mucilaginibacter sp. 44-25]